jgi:predicted membrane protein
MKNSTRFILGVILITLGILFLIEQTGVFGFAIPIWDIVWTFWPLILVFIGAKLLAQGNYSGGLALLLLGVVFLATTLFKWNFFAVLWPLIIITIGASILLKRENLGTSVNVSKKTTDEDRLNETVVFWGTEKKVNSGAFKGGEINVAFGGAEIDLRDAKIAESNAKLHINVAFGGVEIFVPKDCRVVSEGTGILGGWDVAVEKRDIKKPVLTITGGAIFGGVEIK